MKVLTIPTIVAAFVLLFVSSVAGESNKAEHWAFAPIHKIEPAGPGLHGSKHPIDQFICQELKAERLEPVKLADRAVLLRRVYFDLIGLPPTPEQLHDFLNDSSSEAWINVIERLLASPQYGERWGRH